MSIPPVCPDCELRHFGECPDTRAPDARDDPVIQPELVPADRARVAHLTGVDIYDVPILTGHLVPDTLRIRSARHRGVDGWLLAGHRRDDNRRMSVFFEHKVCAERTRARLRSDPFYEITLRDFELEPDA